MAVTTTLESRRWRVGYASVTDTSETLLIINGPDANIDFLVDNAILYEVPENPNWRTEADINIENHRKSNIQLR